MLRIDTQKLIQARINAGFKSPGQVAKTLDLSRNYIYLLEKGKRGQGRVFPFETVHRLAQTYGVHWESLCCIGRDPDPA